MADVQDKTRGPSRMWKIVLVCSLALNLAVAGVVAGTLISGRIGDGPPRSFDLGVGPLAQALTQQERRTIGRALRDGRILRDLNPRARAAEMTEVLSTQPFDPDALRGVFEKQRNDVAGVQERAHAVLVTLIADMTPARRAEFASQIAEALENGRGPRPPRASGD